jgi:imidazolonepropionase
VAAVLCDRIWHHARLATLAPSSHGLGEIQDGMIACRDGVIVYAGAASTAPIGLDAREHIDCEGRWITPGLIDCHTHLVYGGNRAREFEMRLAGASYETIAQSGGGIISCSRRCRAWMRCLRKAQRQSR